MNKAQNYNTLPLSLLKDKFFSVFRIWSLDCLGLNTTEQVRSTVIRLMAYALVPSLLLALWLEPEP